MRPTNDKIFPQYSPSTTNPIPRTHIHTPYPNTIKTSSYPQSQPQSQPHASNNNNPNMERVQSPNLQHSPCTSSNQPQILPSPVLSEFSPSSTSAQKREETAVTGLVRNQQMITLEKEYQSVIRGFELKLKTVSQEYRRCKVQMEIKIKELYKEKVYWANIANNFIEKQKKYMEECNIYNNYTAGTGNGHEYPSNPSDNKLQSGRSTISGNINKSFSTSSNSSSCSSYSSNALQNRREEYMLESQLAKLRGKVQEIERHNQGMCQEKFTIMKEFQRVSIQNNGYKAKLAQYEKKIQELQAQIQKNRIQSQQQQARMTQKITVSSSSPNVISSSSLSSQSHSPNPSNTSSGNNGSNQKRSRNLHSSRSPPPQPQSQVPLYRSLYPSAHQFQSLKLTTQKYRILLTNLNQQVIHEKLAKLNQKYQKNYPHGYSNNYGSVGGSGVTVARGGVYGLNVISDMNARSRRGSQVNL